MSQAHSDESHALDDVDAPSLQGARDWLLVNFVDWANRHGFQIGITLEVSGVIVSGTLIGGAQYFRELGDSVASGFPDKETGGVLGEILRNCASIYEPDKSEGTESVEGEIEHKPPTYIHLQSARLFSPGGVAIPSEGVLWRGKLAAVDSFSLGVLTHGK